MNTKIVVRTIEVTRTTFLDDANVSSIGESLIDELTDEFDLDDYDLAWDEGADTMKTFF